MKYIIVRLLADRELKERYGLKYAVSTWYPIKQRKCPGIIGHPVAYFHTKTLARKTCRLLNGTLNRSTTKSS